jgi:hypothetical protein
MKANQYKIFGIAFISMLFGFNSCINEHHFGKYDQAKILAFSVENQVGTVNIDHDALLITVLVDESSDIENLKINTHRNFIVCDSFSCAGRYCRFFRSCSFYSDCRKRLNSNLHGNCQTQSGRDSAQ